MTKAKLALAAVALSYILINSAAGAADDSTTTPPTGSVIQDTLTHAEPGVNPDTPSNAPLANLAQVAIGDMMDLGGILTSDMPPPPGRTMPQSMPNQRHEEKVALGGAPDGAPPFEWHMGMGPHGMDKGGPGMSGPGMAMGGPGMSGPGMAMGGPGMIGPGMAMGGCPMIRGHHRCPLDSLEGANALSDDQYQKLYDIKGQFIANMVPKGLNMYMLTRKMKDLLTAPDIDTKALKDLEKQISSAASDLSMTAMDSIISANQVLTPDQRKELHKQRIRSTFGGGGYHHHEGPHPEK